MSRIPRPSRRFWRSACAAGAALAVLWAGVAAAAGQRPVVPWSSTRPVKASASPPLAPPCRARDLHAHLFLQGATGSLVGGVDLRNAGSSPCSLLGWPTVSFKGSAARVEKWRVTKLAASPVPPDVLADPPGSLRALQPGKSAGVSVFWSNWCGPLPDAIALGLAGGTTIALPVVHAPRCDAPPDPSLVSVGPFTPTPRHLPPSSRLPLRVTIVGSRPVRVKPGLRAFLVHRGERFRFEVALRNTRKSTFRFARSSCPSYLEQLGARPAQAYVLNCRPVGAVAPHATVRLEMQLTIPVSARLGINSLTWQLAPKTYESPFAPAVLSVVP
jgi:hypothetical protein